MSHVVDAKIGQPSFLMFGRMPVDRIGPEAVAAIRLLALTGCRRSEVLDPRWRDIGDDAIALRDSKTGPRAVPLGAAALGRTSPHCPVRATRTLSCSRATPKAAGSQASPPAGARSAPIRSSAGCGCTTCAIPWPAKP